MKAYVTTFGCPKNLVDSEAAIFVLRRAGCTITNDPGDADLLVVGACSFLEASWRETVEEIERLSRYKGTGGTGAGKRLVLMGCLPKHRGENLEETLPWVDNFLPTGAHGLLPGLIESWRRNGRGGPRTIDAAGVDRFTAFEERDLLTPGHTAYVKVAEGCSRRCSFCAIPAIRGPQITRPPGSVVAEVARMAEQGVKEVTLLAQDVTSYGHEGKNFCDLVDAIAQTGIPWIRLFYLHPAGLRMEHLERVFSIRSVVRYLEIPIQHTSTRLLKRMRRSHDRAQLDTLLSGIRSSFPDAVIRSEVIVGFPGETDGDFDEMKDFVEEFEFDSLGIFPYSREPGTEAASFGDGVPETVVRERVEELCTVQEAASCGVNSRRLGKIYDILIDRELEADEGIFDGCRYAGRFYGQAPEIDGEVYLETERSCVGEFLEAQITETGIFDLKGELVE